MVVVAVAFDVLWNNSELHSSKPLALCIGQLAKLYLFATEKEITVSKQRHEMGLQGQVHVSDSNTFPRCCTSSTAIFLSVHPIHAAEAEVSHLLVYVPKPAKRQPYFKLRTAYRYVLHIHTAAAVPVLHLENQPLHCIRSYDPIFINNLFLPPPPPLPRVLKALDSCGPNLFLEHTFAQFKCFTPLEQRFTEYMLAPSTDNSLMKWTRYVLYDLATARSYADPNGPLTTPLISLQSMIMHAFTVLWQVFCTLVEVNALDQMESAYGVVASLGPLFAQIEPLCKQVYESTYAINRRNSINLGQLTWPHGPIALQQISNHGFVHSPTFLQRDRAICRCCSFVAFAWHRLIPPHVHHHPTCPQVRQLVC